MPKLIITRALTKNVLSMLLNISLILKTVDNNNISVGFNLQYSANEGINHKFNLYFNQMRVRLYFLANK